MEAFLLSGNKVYLTMQDIEIYKQQIQPVLKKYLIKHAAIFGSFAKNKATLISDIDLLIEPAEDFTLFSLLQMEEELAEITHRKVDIVEYSALKDSIRQEVLQTAIRVL